AVHKIASTTAIILLSSCATQTSSRPAPAPAPRREAAQVKPAAKPPRSLSEENVGGAPPSNGQHPSPLGGTVGETGDVAPPPPTAPPDPNMIIASIGPSTPPQRAASLRLTDEGRRLLAQGNSAAALDRIEKAVKIDPSNPHGYYWLAQVHLQNGRLDQALAF